MLRLSIKVTERPVRACDHQSVTHL